MATKRWAGRRVRIVDPRVLVRVGYPKMPADYMAAATALVPAIDAALGGLWPRAATWGLQLTGLSAPYRRLLHDMAYLLADRDEFGGSDRSLHLEAVPDLEGLEVEVLASRRVVTGRRCPGWGGEDGCGPYLDDPRTHVILAVETPDYGGMDYDRAMAINAAVQRLARRPPLHALEIPLAHVEVLPVGTGISR